MSGVIRGIGDCQIASFKFSDSGTALIPQLSKVKPMTKAFGEPSQSPCFISGI